MPVSFVSNSFSQLERAPKLALCRAVSVVACALALGQTPLLAENASASNAALPSTPITFIPADAVTNSLGMKFIAVPGTPVQFCLWETRVKDFEAFLQESHYEWSFKPHFPQTGDHPVVNVNLQDALAFCAWLTRKERHDQVLVDSQSYRLPTNDEWDAAVGLASGHHRSEVALSQKMQEEQSFPWGTEWPPPLDAGNLNFEEINGQDDHYKFTAPVGQFKPSATGLYDLAGNAWEWAWDEEARSDAPGTLRGGSWMYYRRECLLSKYQYKVPIDTRAPSIGFRVVLEDKRRRAAFMIAQEKSEAETSARMKQVASVGKKEATPEEIAKLRESMATRPVSVVADRTLPDASTLKPAQKSQSFINSLGMSFKPLANGSVLFGVYEARVQDYEAYMASIHSSWDRRPTFEIKPTHPVMNISWQDAQHFCTWLTERDRTLHLIGKTDNYRLPTDVEWSQAVGLTNEKGSNPAEKNLANKTDYPWGPESTPPRMSANLDSGHLQSYEDSFPYTAPVGSFNPSPTGFYDLAGNVAEWCEDAWPGASNERVVRGSSWLTSTQENMLSSYRNHIDLQAVRTDLGFRVVLELATSN